MTISTADHTTELFSLSLFWIDIGIIFAVKRCGDEDLNKMQLYNKLSVNATLNDPLAKKMNMTLGVVQVVKIFSAIPSWIQFIQV